MPNERRRVTDPSDRAAAVRTLKENGMSIVSRGEAFFRMIRQWCPCRHHLRSIAGRWQSRKTRRIWCKILRRAQA